MTLKKDTLLINNAKSIRIIDEDGVAINYAPILAYYQLQVSNVIANQPYKFSLARYGKDILPITLTAWSNTNINNADNFFIKIYEGTNYQWGLNLAGKKTIDTNGFLYSFPEIPINQDYIVEITSSVALSKVLISCKAVYIEHELIKSD